ncbi:MAG: NGG1p interacting factor NIF3, partial [Bacillota bacterium]
MTINEIYKYFVEQGIEKDPRKREGVEETLEREKKSYEEMKEEEKKDFDTERLTNPYSDTRI